MMFELYEIIVFVSILIGFGFTTNQIVQKKLHKVEEDTKRNLIQEMVKNGIICIVSETPDADNPETCTYELAPSLQAFGLENSDVEFLKTLTFQERNTIFSYIQFVREINETPETQ